MPEEGKKQRDIISKALWIIRNIFVAQIKYYDDCYSLDPFFALPSGRERRARVRFISLSLSIIFLGSNMRKIMLRYNLCVIHTGVCTAHTSAIISASRIQCIDIFVVLLFICILSLADIHIKTWNGFDSLWYFVYYSLWRAQHKWQLIFINITKNIYV